MAVTELTPITVLLQDATLSTNVNLPSSFAVGTDRVLIITISFYSGSSTAKLPTAITANGEVATFICGGDINVPTNRVALASYMFFDHQLVNIANQSLISNGGGGSFKSIAYSLLGGASQLAPVNYNWGMVSSGGTLTLPLIRDNNSLTIARGYGSASGSTLTFTNPARQGSVFSTRYLSHAAVVDTARTANFTSTAALETQALVFNVKEAGAQSITDVNGGNGIRVGSTGNTATLSGFGGVPTTGSYAGKPISNISGNATNITFDIPGFVDNQTYSNLNTDQTLTLTYNSTSAVIQKTLLPAIGTSVVTVNTPEVYDQKILGFWLTAAGFPPGNGDKLISITSDLVLDPDTSGQSSTNITTTVWHWVLATGITHEYTVTVTENQIVIPELTLNIQVFSTDSGGGNSIEPDRWIPNVAPTLNNVSGTFLQDNTITLTGLNFSKKNPSQSAFIDFSSDTVGQRTSALTYWNGSGFDYLVNDTKSQPIGDRCIFVDADDDDFVTAHYEFPSDQDEVFFEAWSQCNPIRFHQPNTWTTGTEYNINDRVNQIKPAGIGANNTYDFIAIAGGNINISPFDVNGDVNSTFWSIYDQPQVKTFRIVDGTGGVSAQGRPVGMTSIYEDPNSILVIAQDGGLSGAAAHSGYGLAPTSTAWAKYTMYNKIGTKDTPTGKAYCHIGATHKWSTSSHPVNGHLASPNGSLVSTQSLYDGTPFINNITGNSNEDLLMRRVLMTYYHRNQQHTAVGIAHMFINNSPERVVIGDAPTWNACDHTKSYICPQIKRLNKQITFKACISTTLTGNLYAYVVNRDGTYTTNGILVRSI